MDTYYLSSSNIFINIKCWKDNLISIKGMTLSIMQKYFMDQKGKNKKDIVNHNSVSKLKITKNY